MTSAPTATLTPLSGSHIDLIRNAVLRSRKVRRCAGVATVSGWSLLIFALPAILFGAIGMDIPSALLGVMLLIAAWGEFQGAGRLRRLDTKAPRRLAMNQLLLGVTLTAYGAWGIFHSLTGPSPMADVMTQSPEVAGMLGPMEQYWTWGMVGFYGLLIALSIAATGATAAYYNSSRKALRQHLTSTPQWVVDVQRAAA